jgi:hypothetical protein
MQIHSGHGENPDGFSAKLLQASLFLWFTLGEKNAANLFYPFSLLSLSQTLQRTLIPFHQSTSQLINQSTDHCSP